MQTEEEINFIKLSKLVEKFPLRYYAKVKDKPKVLCEYEWCGSVSSGAQGAVFKFKRVDGVETDTTPSLVAVKIENEYEGRQERDCYGRVYNGLRCDHIARFFHYQSVHVDQLESEEKTERKITENYAYKLSWTTPSFDSRIIGLNDSLFDIPEKKAMDFSILVMEFCNRTLLNFVSSQRTVREEEDVIENIIRELFIQLCTGLKHMRDKGLQHRDIKSANLLVKDLGEGKFALKIIDFGIAKVMQKGGLSTKGVGTDNFMAPEMCWNLYHSDYKADIWSAAVVLFSMVNKGCERLRFTNTEETKTKDFLNTFFDEDPRKATSQQEKDALVRKATDKLHKHLIFNPSIPNVEEIKQILKRMLVINPNERDDWEDILDTPWLIHHRKELSFNVEGLEGCKLFTLPVLGKGATGIVYKGAARNQLAIAVKRIKRSYFKPKPEDKMEDKRRLEKDRRRILNEEINVLKRLQKTGCRNVIKFFGVADKLKGGTVFDSMTLVFEYCPTTLTSRIQSGLSEFECHRFMIQIVEALHALYSIGYAHRDIKPDNILIRKVNTRDGVVEEIVLTDFGFAGPLDDLRGWCGTKGYLAPEVKKNKEKSRLMDLYSLGMTLWHMITGVNHPGKKDPEVGTLFITLPNVIRCRVTNSCWETVKFMLMIDPSKRMTYDELWANPWLKATEKELKECFVADRKACLESLWPGVEGAGGGIRKDIMKIIDLYASILWPTEKDQSDKQKELSDAIGSLNANELLSIRGELLAAAKQHAVEGSSREAILPQRAIGEYKIAIVYLSIISTLYHLSSRPENDEKGVLCLAQGLSARISMLESKILSAQKK